MHGRLANEKLWGPCMNKKTRMMEERLVACQQACVEGWKHVLSWANLYVLAHGFRQMFKGCACEELKKAHVVLTRICMFLTPSAPDVLEIGFLELPMS